MFDKPDSLKPAYRIKNKNKPLDGQKLNNTNALKEQLLREMLELDKQRQQLELEGDAVNFAMLQSYREMIQTRRIMLDRLNRQPG